MEFRITFDQRPADIGLRVIDSLGISMWNFDPGSFGSFALSLRENIFTLCLSPYQNYTFEILDLGSDGLVTFNSRTNTTITGSFSLLYENQVVSTYNGDCDDAVDTAARECGEYCECAYQLYSPYQEGSSGECTMDCTLPALEGR